MHGTVTRRLLAAFSVCVLLMTTSCAARLGVAVIGAPSSEKDVELTLIVAEADHLRGLEESKPPYLELVGSTNSFDNYLAMARFRGSRNGVAFQWAVPTAQGQSKNLVEDEVVMECSPKKVKLSVSSDLLESYPDLAAAIIVRFDNSNVWDHRVFRRAEIAGNLRYELDVTAPGGLE